MLRGAVAAGGLSAVSLSATWSDVVFASPTITGTNEDRTLTFTGAARNIEAVTTGDEVGVEYRINSGSWVSYTTAFSVSSTQTVGWRITSALPASATITVRDASRGVDIDAFDVAVS